MDRPHSRSDERAEMVARQIAGRGLRDDRVLEAMRSVPREAFVPEAVAEFAYEDSPLPIDEGQTISQPYIVALMTEAAELGPGDRVLDVGTGSGYAAAVCAAICRHVYSIERHAALAQSAREAFDAAGIDNVTVLTGDGSRGWPDEAPFDAIIVAAGAPRSPESLRRQLAVGGRLVIPVAANGYQHLLRIRRTGEDSFEEEDLGGVRFVPLIGEEGWPDDPDAAEASRRGSHVDPGVRPSSRASPPMADADIASAIRDAAEPLPEIASPAFAAAFDRLGDAAVIGLGEATHGTSEFYEARVEITKRLIEEHGVRIVAVEADWPDASRIDRYVRNRKPAPWRQPAFTRFPAWMWRNDEVNRFIEWLRAFNLKQPRGERVSFHGLDLYALDTSVSAVIGYLEEVDPDAAQAARKRYRCLSPWQKDPVSYGQAAVRKSLQSCEKDVVATLGGLLERRLQYVDGDDEEFLDAEGNAQLVRSAEEYYRTLYYGDRSSWNLRDRHMFETLQRIRAARPDPAKAVIWAHNSHIGDAAATDMGAVRGELNIGQLCCEAFGADAALVGFGTDRGEVAAASDWGGPMEIKTIRPARDGSIEGLCRDAAIKRFLLDLGHLAGSDLADALDERRLQRAIGVIYRPETELASHYFETSLPRQFDHYVWFRETRPITPLAETFTDGAADTYPFGL